MMRCRMKCLRDTQPWKRAVAYFPGHHEGRDIGDPSLKGKGHQIEHEFCMFLPIVGHTTGRSGHSELRITVLLFGNLDAAFDLANGVQVFGHAVAVVRAKISLEAVDLTIDYIMDAV